MNRIMASHYETEQGAVYCETATPARHERQRLRRLAARPAPALLDLRPDGAAARRRLRPDAAAALARRQLQPVPRQQQPVPVRRARTGLDRDHGVRPRARRLVLRLRRVRHVRDVGGHRGALHARPRVDRDQRLLDGRLRDLQARRPVPRPVREGPAGRRSARRRASGSPPAPPQPGGDAVEHEPHARVVPQRPVPDLERHARTSSCRVASAQAQAAEFGSLGLPLRVGSLHDRRPLRARDQRRVRAGGELPRHDRGRPQPAARDLRPQPDDGLRDRPADRRPRLLALGDHSAKRRRHGAARHDRRAARRASASATRRPPASPTAPAS